MAPGSCSHALLPGGSEWTLEDTIRLKNVEVPAAAAAVCNGYVDGADVSSPCGITVTDTSGNGQPSATSRRQIVQLDWVSTEDGGHVLTVGVGSSIRLYAAVPGDVAMTLQAGPDRRAPPAPPSRGVLQKSKSMAVHSNAEAAAAACERRWVQIRAISLSTADGRPPTPLDISWVRSGVLVVSLDSEMHVYSQWHCPGPADDLLPPAAAVTSAAQASSPLLPSASLLLTPSSGLPPKSVSAMKRDASIASLSLLAEKDRRRGASVARSSISAENSPAAAMKVSDSIDSFRAAIRDCGLFEAARRASPCLPQYHPRQLIELLNFGKIRRVKAILAHLLRCIAGSSAAAGGDAVESGLGGPTMDATTAGLVDEHSPNYVEISSIPALPLYALLAADCAAVPATDHKTRTRATPAAAGDLRTPDYTTLFTTETSADDALDEPLEDTDVGGGTRPAPPVDTPLPSSSAGVLEFTPAQAHLLVRHLTHTQLPGLSSLDQMYLLAVAETVANTKVDFTSSGFTASTGRFLYACPSVEEPSVL